MTVTGSFTVVCDTSDEFDTYLAQLGANPDVSNIGSNVATLTITFDYSHTGSA